MCCCPVRLSAQTADGNNTADVVRLLPLATTYALKGCGVESSSSWRRLAVNTVTSLALSSAVTYGLKYGVSSERPDHTDSHGFPSGHAMVAFSGATVLRREYGRQMPWLAVAGYGVAVGVGIDRVQRDRHTWLQAGAGAAVGVIGTELGYWLGDRLTGEHSQFAVVPSTDGIALCISF